ncbi:MAG: RNA degradosome polyphosphate kinase [Clostridia bacterium]|nr:RNA degradosome polyphosphate kinase [Clostridia bacterium]
MKTDFGLKPEQVINRELSWLEFNQRVLDEAVSPFNPVFEQMKFLSIASSNLDEFFMIRVGSLWDQIDAGYRRPDFSGLTPRDQVSAISQRAHVMMKRMYSVLRRDILPCLAENGIRFADIDALTEEQSIWLDQYYDDQIYPVLTPMAVDAARPFPLILSRTLNLGLLLETKDGEHQFATVQVPSGLNRLVQLPGGDGKTFLLLEQIVARSIGSLFHGRNVICCAPYRITRNADMSIDEEDAADLLKEIEKSLKQRRWGAVVRLEIDYRADERIKKVLMKSLELEESEVYAIHGPINLDFLMREMYKLPGYEALKYTPYSARRLMLDEGESMFDRIAKGDLMLYHPYDSFEPVIQLIREAARDPKVLAIKQTLYRVSSGSPIIAALIEAAEAGKQVTVLLELKARFDEENNIHWGRRLEKAGAHVIYGVAHLKTHSKITLIVRAEQNGIRRYVHLATGNYNDVTANIYTDHGLFTCSEAIGRDASAFFNMISGHTAPPRLAALTSAPHDLRAAFLSLIDQETAIAKEGRRAEITAKMNSLVDEEIISALYRASQAGVRVRLIVRGICCLRPGIKGLSDRITVRSIVGRFLEHSRIFCFRNDGVEKIFLSSADWMPRNLDRRVELMFPVENDALKKRLKATLRIQWADNTKAREMQPDGSYRLLYRPDEEHTNAQEEFMLGADLN